jgi:hypothetical protein
MYQGCGTARCKFNWFIRVSSLQQALELRKGMTDGEGEEQQLDRVN